MVRKIIGIVVSIALAAVGTAVLVLYIRGAEDRALAGEEIVTVLVADDEIAQGTAAEDLEPNVRSERVPVKVQAAGSVAELDELSGRVASTDLLPGEQLTLQRFIQPEDLGAIEVPDGLLQVTVPLEPARALGGRLAPGDHVAVFASFELEASPEESGEDDGDEDEEQTRLRQTTHLILHKVLVTEVQRTRTGSPAAPTQDEEQEDVPSGTLLVTLAIDAPAGERVVFAAEHGTVWLGSEPDDAPEAGTRVQTPETIYR